MIACLKMKCAGVILEPMQCEKESGIVLKPSIHFFKRVSQHQMNTKYHPSKNKKNTIYQLFEKISTIILEKNLLDRLLSHNAVVFKCLCSHEYI